QTPKESNLMMKEVRMKLRNKKPQSFLVMVVLYQRVQVYPVEMLLFSNVFLTVLFYIVPILFYPSEDEISIPLKWDHANRWYRPLTHLSG
ncbi:MAG TPA: hypothetical protein VFF29_01010, partial [Bacteroidota bacterium]|nr:hypothetical protein [Bacteroidota bacterium]